MKIDMMTAGLVGLALYLAYRKSPEEQAIEEVEEVVVDVIDDAPSIPVEEDPSVAGLSGIHRAVALGNIHSRPWWRDTTRRLRGQPIFN